MLPLLVGLALILALGLVFVRLRLRKVTIYEFERGLRYTRGRLKGVAEPGQYWLWTPTTTVRTIDMRTHIAPVAGQEVLSADGVAVKASLIATYRIADPAQAVNAVENFQSALYSALQLALRAVIASRPIDELLQHRASLGSDVVREAGPAIAQLGLELIQADIKDLTLPGELKKIFAQVVRARQEGLAALEKARGETAALRSLANAAQMIGRNPHLMQVRLLQVLGERSGNTVVLGVPASAGPIPVRGTEEVPVLPEPSEGTEA